MSHTRRGAASAGMHAWNDAATDAEHWLALDRAACGAGTPHRPGAVARAQARAEARGRRARAAPG